MVVELGQLHELLDSVRTPSEEIDMDMDLGEEFEALEISAYEDTSGGSPRLISTLTGLLCVMSIKLSLMRLFLNLRIFTLRLTKLFIVSAIDRM